MSEEGDMVKGSMGSRKAMWVLSEYIVFTCEIVQGEVQMHLKNNGQRQDRNADLREALESTSAK